MFIISSFYAQQVSAQEIQLSPDDDLQQALNSSHNGDVITLEPGNYFGNFIIPKQVTLRSNNRGEAIIDSQGKGHGLWLKNSHITIENLTITNWGNDLTEQNSGIYSHDKIDNNKVPGLTISSNILIGDGFGIWLNQADKANVSHNRVKGNLTLRSADRGNGIQIANVTNSHVFLNEVSETRDGVYVISSQNNIIEQNTMHHLR